MDIEKRPKAILFQLCISLECDQLNFIVVETRIES